MAVIWFRDVAERLRGMDGRPYPAYRDLRGVSIDYGGGIRLVFTRIQGDPHAPPSWAELRVPWSRLGFPGWMRGGEAGVALEDYLARRLAREARAVSDRCGSGYSCVVSALSPGPWILRRSSVEISGDGVVFRLKIGLPARGRRILGSRAAVLVEKTVPRITRGLLDVSSSEMSRVAGHIEVYRDQEYLRRWLIENGYVVFVGDGSVLPRETGFSEKPLRGARPFRSPPELRVYVDLPSGRRVSGMALPRGLHMVTGGGFHGKTTLLDAIQQGIYSHVEGDGRELVVTVPRAFYVEAEDGRVVSCVDISSHVGDLPGGRDTVCFSTLDASGSTSMAASISEAVELGAQLLLFDEDTSATNLLYKDSVMEALIRLEPIRPLYHMLRSMAGKTGCSVVGVVSASSYYIPVADHVVLMENYAPRLVTEEAKRLAGDIPARSMEYRVPRSRVFRGIEGLVEVEAKAMKIIARYRDGGVYELDLSRSPRIVERGQARLAARLIGYIDREMRGLSMRRIAEELDRVLREKGFTAVYRVVPPDVTWISGLDVVWILNRLPRLRVEQAA